MKGLSDPSDPAEALDIFPALATQFSPLWLLYDRDLPILTKSLTILGIADPGGYAFTAFCIRVV